MTATRTSNIRPIYKNNAPTRSFKNKLLISLIIASLAYVNVHLRNAYASVKKRQNNNSNNCIEYISLAPLIRPFSKPETDNTNLLAFCDALAVESLFDDNKEN